MGPASLGLSEPPGLPGSLFPLADWGSSPSLFVQISFQFFVLPLLLAKETDFQEVQEAQRVPKKLGLRRYTPRHIIIILPKVKVKERILKEAREKETVTYKGVPIRLSANFSKETLQTRRDWQEVFQVMKGKGLHTRLLYPAKLSFRMEGKIKCFSDKVKLKEFIITKPLLYAMIKGLI